MATALTVVVFILCVTVVPPISAGEDCKSYRDINDQYHFSEDCMLYCCGTCMNRYCCTTSYKRLTEKDQDQCSSFDYQEPPIAIIVGTISGVVILVTICCCVCPCCVLYKMCRRTTPVIATTTHTTVTTHYPQQPTASPSPAYQAAQYPAYQPVPVQPGYGGQPMQPGYGAQHMPTAPYQGQQYTPGPPPPYQEAAGYAPASMAYSQAGFTPGQAPYPLQPPGQQTPQTDQLSSQPAYNPAYVEPPKTVY